MSNYLFIQSQDPYTEVRTAQQFELATQLHTAGHTVRLVLVQNGVVPARQEAQCAAFDRLLQSGVEIIADDFSLAQREIAADRLKQPISLGSMDVVIDALLAGHKVIWN